MSKNIIFTLAGVLLVAVFALQNSEPFVVTFLFWEVQMIGSLVLISFLLLGAIMGFMGSYKTLKQKDKRIKEMENDINQNKNAAIE